MRSSARMRPSAASLQAGTTYVFNAAGISGSHPFAVGSSRGTHQAWMTGSVTGMSGSTGTFVASGARARAPTLGS